MIVARKRVIFTNHARKGLQEKRQNGVEEWDVYSACQILSSIIRKGLPTPIRFGGFTSKLGVKFSVVLVDKDDHLAVVTVIGHQDTKPVRGRPEHYYKLSGPHKEIRRKLKKLQKIEKSWKGR